LTRSAISLPLGGLGSFLMIAARPAEILASSARSADAERRQFAAIESIAARNAEISKHVCQHYRWPRMQQVCGARSPTDFYALSAVDRIRKSGCIDVASVGSGDCSTEVQVARRIKQAGMRRAMAVILIRMTTRTAHSSISYAV
jgi:hypothetical protein